MLIQGKLQTVFDALYEVGAIDPVLKKDWRSLYSEVEKNPHSFMRLMDVVNSQGGDFSKMVQMFKSLDQHSLYLIAMEVAREYAEFHGKTLVH